jgi:hypothetical protein
VIGRIPLSPKGDSPLRPFSMGDMTDEQWLQERLETVQEVKYELRKLAQEGRIKDKRLLKLLLRALQVVHMYEVELEDRLDELSTTGDYGEKEGETK